MALFSMEPPAGTLKSGKRGTAEGTREAEDNGYEDEKETRAEASAEA